MGSLCAGSTEPAHGSSSQAQGHGLRFSVCSAKRGTALGEMGSPLLTAAAGEGGRGRAPYLRMFMGATLSHVLVLGL